MKIAINHCLATDSLLEWFLGSLSWLLLLREAEKQKQKKIGEEGLRACMSWPRRIEANYHNHGSILAINSHQLTFVARIVVGANKNDDKLCTTVLLKKTEKKKETSIVSRGLLHSEKAQVEVRATRAYVCPYVHIYA